MSPLVRWRNVTAVETRVFNTADDKKLYLEYYLDVVVVSSREEEKKPDTEVLITTEVLVSNLTSEPVHCKTKLAK